jgi:hypothetical protein
MKRKRAGSQKFFKPIDSVSQPEPDEQVDDVQAGEENNPNSARGDAEIDQGIPEPEQASKRRL